MGSIAASMRPPGCASSTERTACHASVVPPGSASGTTHRGNTRRRLRPLGADGRTCALDLRDGTFQLGGRTDTWDTGRRPLGQPEPRGLGQRATALNAVVEGGRREERIERTRTGAAGGPRRHHGELLDQAGQAAAPPKSVGQPGASVWSPSPLPLVGREVEAGKGRCGVGVDLVREARIEEHPDHDPGEHLCAHDEKPGPRMPAIRSKPGRVSGMGFRSHSKTNPLS